MDDLSYLQTCKFIIEDLIYIPTGNYNPVYIRPYEVKVNGESLNTLADTLDEIKSPTIPKKILSEVASDFVQNSAVAYPSIINNDWVSNKKFIFLLKVRTTGALELETMSYIFGYTEYDGITNTGNIDPNLKHKINNVLETTVVRRNIAGFGIIEKEMLYRFYNVTVNNHNNILFTIRPFDIYSRLSTKMLYDNLNTFSNSNIEVYHKSGYYHDFDKRPITNNIDNNIPVNYLSKVLNSGLLKIPESDLFINSNTTEIDNTIPSEVIEPTLRSNYFIKTLERLNGVIIPTNEFTFNNLMSIDFSINNRFKVINITKDYVNPTINNTPEVGDYWHGQDIVTLKAYSIIESSVALALKHGFSFINFAATNMNTIMNEPEIAITNFNSFIKLEENDFYTLLEIFKQNFKNEIFINESNGNKLPLYVELYIDLLGTSKVFLNYANMGGNWYTIPTFANSEFAPVLAFNNNSIETTVDNFKYTIDNLISLRRHSYGSNYY